VLTLRAGIGAAPPRSRGSVARRLDISVRRVARLERTGLRRLRALSGNGSCAPAGGTVASGTTAPSTLTAAIAPIDGERSGGGRGNDDSRKAESTPGGGVSTDDEPSGGGVAGVSGTNRPAEDAINITIPLILLVLLAAAILVTRRLRREEVPVAPVEETKPVWVPWRRSTMTGPSWNERPPPSGEDSWAESPSKAPEPEHEPWTAPRPKRPVR
jgi:hypothetical protein